MHCIRPPREVEPARSDQEREINEVFHAAISRTSGQCIRVEFFGKLLFLRNRMDLWSSDAHETQPVSALNDLHRLNDRVADSGIQMKSREDPAVHPSFNGNLAPP